MESSNGPPARGEQLGVIDSVPQAQAIRRSNRWLAMSIVLAVFALAAGALVFMLTTQSKRGLKPLAALETLGYLPDDTNVIAAVNMPIAERSKQGREMLDRLGITEGGPLNLERLTGLKPDQIDNAVLGLMVDVNLLPNVRLVIGTRSPYDADMIREKLGAHRSHQEGNKTVELITLRGLPREGAMWRPNSRTIVITLPPEDMAKVPDEPSKDINRLPAPLVELLKYRSDKDTFFWLVAHSENWAKTPVGFALMRVPKDDLKTTFKIQTFGVGLRADTGAMTSRRRPARVTEEAHPEAAGIAADVVIKTAGGDDAVELRNAFEDWIDRMKLEVKDSNLSDNRYSATISGTPAEWERVFQTLRDMPPKGK
jgi:hypothetical protein